MGFIQLPVVYLAGLDSDDGGVSGPALGRNWKGDRISR